MNNVYEVDIPTEYNEPFHFEIIAFPVSDSNQYLNTRVTNTARSNIHNAD